MVFWGEYIAYLVIQQFHCSFYIKAHVLGRAREGTPGSAHTKRGSVQAASC